MDRKLILKLRQLVAEIPNADMVEAMWQFRGVQAGTPQAIFRVGDEFASVIYLDLIDSWEVQFPGQEIQFDSFDEAEDWLKEKLPSTIPMPG